MIVLGCLQLQLQFLAIFAISCCSMFAKQLLLFFAKSPLSSPLLCFAGDEIVHVHTLYGIWADDQELVRNLASLAAAPTLPSPLFSIMMPWCSQVHDQMMIDMFLKPLLMLLLVFLIYCCFIWLLWFIDLFYFLYLLAYLKHTFLHLLEQCAK